MWVWLFVVDVKVDPYKELQGPEPRCKGKHHRVHQHSYGVEEVLQPYMDCERTRQPANW